MNGLRSHANLKSRNACEWIDRMTEQLSNKIRFLSFVASFMVVMIHCNLCPAVDRRYLIVVQDGIYSFAVPFFFLVSGYFFMNRYRQTFDWWVVAVKKRLYSLAMPYLFWTLTAILVGFMVHGKCSGLLPALGITVVTPANPPMWYLKMLLIMAMISPVIIWGVRYLGKIVLITLSIAILTLLAFDIPGIKTIGRTFLYFSSGVAIAIYCNPPKCFLTNSPVVKFIASVILWAIVISVELIVDLKYNMYWTRMWLYMPLINVPLIWYGYDLVCDKIPSWQKVIGNQAVIALCRTSFFIYCSHYIFIMILNNIWQLGSTSEITIAGLFVFLLCMVVAVFTRKLFPFLYKFLTGGRL